MKITEIEKILPPKIIKNLKNAFKEFKLTESQKEKAIEKVLELYKKSCYEPGEAIGVVAAQSISEPATQMSLSYEEKILIKENGIVSPMKIGIFVDELIERFGFIEENGSEILDLPNNMNFFVYSLDKDEKIKLKRIKSLIRHKSPEKLLELKTSSGRKIIATDHHSFVIRNNNRIIPTSGKELKTGDRIPAMKFLPENCISEINISSILPNEDLIKTNNYVYPYNAHSKGLPDKMQLNSSFGWFVGAYISEGNATKYFVNISNTDESFNQNVRIFAQKFNFTINEYDNFRGFSKGHDLHVNSSLLSKLLKETCGVDSKSKKVPLFAFSAKKEFVAALLQSYFDGDGNITLDRKGIRASSESKELIDGIAILLARFGIFCSKSDDGHWLWIPYKYSKTFLEEIGTVLNERKTMLRKLSKKYESTKRTNEYTDMIPGIGNLLFEISKRLGLPTRYVNSFTKRQKIGRETLRKLIEKFEKIAKEKNINIKEIFVLKQAIASDVVWDRIEEISYIDAKGEYVYDISVEGLETFTTFEGIVTHNTMRTYHVAGAAEIRVTLGLPRLVEIFDARRSPKTPTMTVYLQKSYNSSGKAQEVAAEIQETRLRDLSIDPAVDLLNMQIEIPLEPNSLKERSLRINKIIEKLKENFKDLIIKEAKDKIIIKTKEEVPIKVLQKLKTKILDSHIKGVKGVSEVRITQKEDEWIINTLGSNFAKVLEVHGIDAKRTTTNNIHEILKVLGIEAARQAIVRDAFTTMKEGGLSVDIRHIMLVADMMTADGDIKAIGRYGVAGAKGSVLARANFEETIKHLTKAAVKAETDKLESIIENVMINQVVPVGTGMFDLVFKLKTENK